MPSPVKEADAMHSFDLQRHKAQLGLSCSEHVRTEMYTGWAVFGSDIFFRIYENSCFICNFKRTVSNAHITYKQHSMRARSHRINS